MRRPALPTLLTLSLFLALPVHAEEPPAEIPEPAEQAAPQEPQRPSLEERSQEQAAALQRQLPKDEQQVLQAGEERFLALWKPANVPEPKGLVVLVPGADESADWPRAIRPLRLGLPDVGWSSLSLSLPDSPEAPLPEAILPRQAEALTADVVDTPTEAEAESEEQAAAEEDEAAETAEAEEAAPAATVDPAERIFARIKAGIAFAEQQDAGQIVLLGHGEGAYWAALYLKERKPAARGLVVVAPRLPGGQTPPLEELIPGLELATGDFFYKDQAAERGNAVRRKQASQRLGREHYTQIALKALPADPQTEQEQLLRRVRGWLDKQ